MKNKTIITIIFCIALSLFSYSNAISYAETLSEQRATEINEDFRGLWVATVLNLDYPLKATTDSETLKREALKIIEDADAMGINAIVLQIRPSGDALYKSSIYPWSKFLTGKQGLAPSNNFDPLQFWIDEAHKRDIAIHAWINPYRITKKTASEPALNYAALSANHPAILHPEWVVEHTDGNLYFNPGLPEVRQHIVDSILEIINQYDVDGIHFDDYFYPGTTFNDAETYAKYGTKFTSISDWRRDNVNQLVSSVYSAIKANDPSVQFGISPFGIWANEKSTPTGSETNGFESYFSQYADSKKWVQENMIDYIAPQIYWNIGFTVADYSKLVKWWSDVAKDSKVNLYVGHAAYRVGNTDSTSPWHGVNEIYRQLALNKNYANIQGSIFFRYAFFKDNYELRSLITNYYQGNATTPIQDQLVIGRPYKDVTTTNGFYFIGGASDPRYPLYLNGVEVTLRTSQGYFGAFVPLNKGANTFALTQNGKTVKRVITKGTGALAPPMSKIEIIPTTVWPQSTRMIKNNEEITFSCKAPIGAVVTATLNGKTYTLIPSTKTSTSTKPYATTYYLKTILPIQTGTGKIIDLGKPAYKMTYKGNTYTMNAPSSVKIALDGAPYIATVSKDFADTYASSDTSNGGHFILHRGMRDYVTGELGTLVRLSSGIWIKKENVTLSTGKLNNNVISKVAYLRDMKSDEIRFTMNEEVVSSVTYTGSKLLVTFSQTGAGSELVLPSTSKIASVTYKTLLKTTTYELIVKDPSKLSGYYLEDMKDGVKLVLKNKFEAYSNNPNLPLSGATIMIDPGHGGTDSGAIGLLGLNKPEKAIANDYALLIKTKLEAFGATVVLTRTEDIYTSLNDRLYGSREVMPDLFISIHADSLDDTSDLNKVSGFSIYYKDRLAKSFADLLLNNVDDELGRKIRGVKTANFYVVRGTWTPSILIETGFMPNPSDYQWLTDPYEQDRFAETTVNAIVEYFLKK